MNDRDCPKCPKGSIYATNVLDRDLSLPKSQSEVFGIRAVVNQPVAVRRLICATCGYLETYVVDQDFLKEVPSSEVWVKA